MIEGRLPLVLSLSTFAISTGPGRFSRRPTRDLNCCVQAKAFIELAYEYQILGTERVVVHPSMSLASENVRF
jgi:hypothetical protein